MWHEMRYALRVRVYAGIDPVTKKRHNLIEVVEPGPKALRKAEEIRDRFLREIAEKRNPRTSATIDQLLTRYLDQLDGSARTLELYRGYVRKHISPLLGRVKVGELDPDVLDSFYSELRRCRHHCDGRRFVQHRTTVAHECDDRCGQHRCQPLGPTTVRHMHFVLSGAYRKAVRWRWVSVSPIAQAEPPPAPPQNPQPPSPADAARIVNEAWRDPGLGCAALMLLRLLPPAQGGSSKAEDCQARKISGARACVRPWVGSPGSQRPGRGWPVVLGIGPGLAIRPNWIGHRCRRTAPATDSRSPSSTGSADHWSI
jgi:hypothetical protein